MKRLLHQCITTPPNSPLNCNSSGESRSSDEYDDLQSSLKRVRISTSPGELRLDRDLQELGWSSSCRQLAENIILDRCHALGIVVHVLGNHSMRIQLDFPRLYPHVGPILAKLDKCSSLETMERAQRIVIEWSPIMTLKDYLTLLLQQLSDENATATTTTITTTYTTTNMTIDTTDAPVKYQAIFSENRFDMGYTRPSTSMIFSPSAGVGTTTTALNSSSSTMRANDMEC